jgi:hypothetical protein
MGLTIFSSDISPGTSSTAITDHPAGCVGTAIVLSLLETDEGEVKQNNE